MQKSLRAGTKRPSPWCSLMLSEALPAQSWDLGDRGRAGGGPWPGNARPSLVLLCTVDADTSQCGLSRFLTYGRYVAERHFRSQGTRGGERQLTCIQRKFCCSQVPESVLFKLCNKNKTPSMGKSGTWKTGLQMTFSI